MQAVGAEVDRVVKRRRIADAQRIESAVKLLDLVGEGDELAHVGGEFDQAHLILLAQQSVDEVLGRALFEIEILGRAAAGVDGEDEVEGQFRLALEDRNLLRMAVLEDLEIVFAQAAHNRRRSCRSR